MKPWPHSRTLWFNAICSALAAAEASFNMVQPLLPINVYTLLAFVLPVGNAALRILTTTAIGPRA